MTESLKASHFLTGRVELHMRIKSVNKSRELQLFRSAAESSNRKSQSQSLSNGTRGVSPAN